MEKQTMRRLLTALALIIAAGPAAHAGCKDEVASALERQRKTSGFRMQTKMLSDQGVVDMTVDYMLPNRMRQVIKSTVEPKPVETVVIGRDAWSRMEGEPWRPLHPQVADALAAQMQETLGDDQGALGSSECLGKQAVAQQNLLAYQGENVEPGPENLSPGVAEKPKLPDRPVRVIYVDPITGLPMRSIYARANKLDKPIFEATYSYPADIRVDAPPAPGAPVDKPAEKK
ncbi:MAG: hypothetical protein M5U16_00630 [Hyphomicrobium sp.]|nr:hypothetical protein [Hyphomicrobium sp.]